MIGTVFSLVAGVLLWLHSYSSEVGIGWEGVRTILIAVASFVFVFPPLAVICGWLPIQKAGQYSSPQIFELFSQDSHIKFSMAYLLAFGFATLLIIPGVKGLMVGHHWLLPVWVVAFGVAVDCIGHTVKRITGYLNPFAVVGMFAKRAEQSILDNRELDLCQWLDGITEIALKGIQRHSTSITHEALDEEQVVIRHFLEISKTLGHPQQDEQTKAVGIKDKVSYVLFHLYQRLDVIFEAALKNKLEMTCSHLIRQMGKVVIDAAKYDISLASAPLRFLGKFARKAQQEGFEESVITASCVLSEVANQLLTEVDITYGEIRDPFLSIINGLEVITKGEFQRDKTINILILEQPFKDLKALFEGPKVKDHQDTPVIMTNINRVLGEFEALQLVLATRPPIPKVDGSLG